MTLFRVTFTGADDSVDIGQLIEISSSHPYVEWGILFSQSNQGLQPRYPSVEWLRELYKAKSNINVPLNLSAHLCGRWVRDLILLGDFTWLTRSDLGSYFFQRIQLNFHGRFHEACPEFSKVIRTHPYEFILQCDGVNDRPAKQLIVGEGLAVPLFDRSGGAGLTPDEWPRGWNSVYCGYAGGLGPANIAIELPRIEAAAHPDPDEPHFNQRFWIDMESNVRSFDNESFSMVKVRQVLEICDQFIKSPWTPA